MVGASISALKFSLRSGQKGYARTGQVRAHHGTRYQQINFCVTLVIRNMNDNLRSLRIKTVSMRYHTNNTHLTSLLLHVRDLAG